MLFSLRLSMKSSLYRRISVLGLLLCCAALALSCGEPQASPTARRYELRGRVVAVDRQRRQVTVAHDRIDGFMEAMTMPFALRRADWAFDAMAAGDRINAILIVDGERSWLEQPVITRQENASGDAAAPVASSGPEPGADVPDFPLTNQDDRRISLGQYRGRALLLTFIYTRCPLPDYCILMSENFAEIERALRDRPELRERVRLLSITLDPEYDTPRVLRSYGAAHTRNYDREDFARWHFATGSPQEIRDVATFFGLSYQAANNEVIHSLCTALISPAGKVVKIYQGNEWRAADALRDIESMRP